MRQKYGCDSRWVPAPAWACITFLFSLCAPGGAGAQEQRVRELLQEMLWEIRNPPARLPWEDMSVQQRQEINDDVQHGRAPTYDRLRDQLVLSPRAALQAIAEDQGQEYIVRWLARMLIDRQERPAAYEALAIYRLPASQTNWPESERHTAQGIVCGARLEVTTPEHLMPWLELCIWPGWVRVRLNAQSAVFEIVRRSQGDAQGPTWELTPQERLDVIRVLGFTAEDATLVPYDNRSYIRIATVLSRLVQEEAFCELARLWRLWRPQNEGSPHLSAEDLETMRQEGLARGALEGEIEQSRRDGNPALRKVGENPAWDAFVDAFAQTPQAEADADYLAAVQDMRPRREELRWGYYRYKSAEELERDFRRLEPEFHEEWIRRLPTSILRRVHDRFPEHIRPLVDRVLAERQ